jgi:hypothetical protein
MRVLATIALVQLALLASARADEPEATDPTDALANENTLTPLHEDNEIGPVILIEDIEISGNTVTQTDLIQRALPIQVGDILHASDRRLRDTRFRVLALGYFRDVTLAMRKGSARGRVVIEIHVIERGTFVLNRLWFGTNALTPQWIGTDIGDRNVLGLGLSIGGGAIIATHGAIEGARDQGAAELRISDSGLGGSRFGASASLTTVDGSEVYRVSGSDAQWSDSNFQAFPYRRFGARGAITYDLSDLSRVSATLRVEDISAELPNAPTETLPDGAITAIDLGLHQGTSRVVTAGFGFDRDTRPDPVLPHSGGRVQGSAEVGSSAFGSDYQFASFFGRFEHWWPFQEELYTVGLRVGGGIVVGDAPRFDLIHISDVDPMLTPRALGLVLSDAPPFDFLHTRNLTPSYGDVGGLATIEVARKLWRGNGQDRVYGGDAFVSVGLWGLATNDELAVRDTSLWSSLPIDLTVDAGVRIDTEVGIFELTIANALGRLR